MKQRAKSEQDKVNALKVARVAIRVKHMIAADTEINEVLPKLEDRIDALQNEGLPWRMITSGNTPRISDGILERYDGDPDDV